MAARQWLMGGDTKDRGKGRRQSDEVQTVPHSKTSLAKQFRTSPTSITQARDLLAEAADMTGGQRAMVAARQWLMNGDENNKGGRPSKKPNQPDPVSRNSLAKQFRTSVNSITQARDLLTGAPDLAAQVESGASLANAAAAT